MKTKSNDKNSVEEILQWCASVFGTIEVISDHSQEHAGHRATALRLRTPAQVCYLKIHRDPLLWESEVHGYAQWAPAFGDFAPQLLAVKDEEPLALVISELPGKILEEMALSVSQERQIWQSAGQALAGLHNLASGEFFGLCRRDGTRAGPLIIDAREYLLIELEDWIERGQRGGFLSANELAILRAARELIPAFEGERPVPSHRDYCPANWLVSSGGAWTGVIDFEFSRWDVRSTDLTRFPNWEWKNRLDLMEAFFAGYSHAFTPEEEQQRVFSQALYAIGAIAWGEENSYHIFAEEGRQALKHLKRNTLLHEA